MNQSDNPKVSVIIPTYNRADLLPRAVNSVLAQTYSDLEIIIVDDCSPDDTREVIARFSDLRIRSFRHERNKGLSAARNTGIANARGEYIAFLDDDDEYLPSKLEEQVELLNTSSNDVGLVYGWLNWIDGSSGRVLESRRSAMQGDIFDEALAMNGPSSPPSWLARSSVIREVGGFDEKVYYHEDRVLLCRIAQRYSAAVLPKVVAHIHTGHSHLQATSRTKENLLRKATHTRAYIDAFTNELNERPKAFAQVLCRLAVDEMMCAHPLASLGAFATAVKLNPWNRATLTCAPLLVKIFFWYATPLSRFRLRAKSMLGRWNPNK